MRNLPDWAQVGQLVECVYSFRNKNIGVIGVIIKVDDDNILFVRFMTGSGTGTLGLFGDPAISLKPIKPPNDQDTPP